LGCAVERLSHHGRVAKRKVVVTGAAGTIFSRMIGPFRERFDLTLLDVRQHDPR